MSNKENSSKMKGLLKGLRYISQIFDDDKEQEIQIGFPTDVKHVAHIGWDGPSTMNEFQSPPGFASAPLSQNGEMTDKNMVKCVSEDSSRRSSRSSMSPTHDPELPKSSRRQSLRGHEGGGGGTESPREKSDKPRQTRRPSRRDSSEGNRGGRQEATDTSSESSLPDIPKKSRRKKSKESAIGGSKKKKDPGTPSTAKSNSIELSQNSFQEGEDKGFT
ncbi:CRIB domain-containing protein RIC6-like isoform X2 [Rosa rugosa]|uniref:CRIB domain-containing protein RIC6-like isoform X2 n=1 Tax=Rosa rugosa TaxID=74645 RepID=UPI002B405E5E|nr:CRIB domain-containing protein RIC6-like isoform X2 [Rosa rugosa]